MAKKKNSKEIENLCSDEKAAVTLSPKTEKTLKKSGAQLTQKAVTKFEAA